MSVAAPIQTDNSEVEAIVGAEDLAVTLRRSSNGQARRPDCKCVEKLTSFNHIYIPHSGRPFAVRRP